METVQKRAPRNEYRNLSVSPDKFMELCEKIKLNEWADDFCKLVDREEWALRHTFYNIQKNKIDSIWDNEQEVVYLF